MAASYAWLWAGSVRVKGRSADFEWHSLWGRHSARTEETESSYNHTHINTWRHVRAHTEQLNHFETFILSNQCFSFLKKSPATKPGVYRRTHDADGRLWESVCAVISFLTTLTDFSSLNYHLAQTSGAPQYHRQTAISTCPQRGHKMEETHLNKKAPHKQGREEKRG